MGKYEKLANDIVENIGGKENIISLTHCVTRLRFILKDETLAHTDVLKNMDGVVTVIQAAGQYQVVIGNHVPDVYKDVCSVADIHHQNAEATTEKQPFSKKILELITGIFMPTIGILCASGILKGVNILLDMANIVDATSGLGELLSAGADAMFLFLPIILGFNTFKKLGGDPFLGMTLGAALVYPTLQAKEINVLGFNVIAQYTSTVLPIILLAFFAVPFEKWLNKVIPDVIKAFVVPALVIFLCVPLGFCIIGPIANIIGYVINLGITAIYNLNAIIAGGILGFIWQILVLFGCHGLVVIPMIMSLLEGQDQPLMVAMMLPCFVQTGAVIAIWLKTKDSKLKAIALPAWISGIFGVTEPAIYGVTLSRGKQFLFTCIGSGIVSALAMWLGTSQYTMGGMGIFSIPAMIDKANPTGSLIAILISIVVALILGFIGAFITYKDNKNDVKQISDGIEMIASPLSGIVKPLSEVKDEAFSQELLGKGIAIEPTDGKVVSPVDGTIITLFPSKHAIGVLSDQGCEILIHLGMDTVQLNGKHFESYVKQKDRVNKGDLLVDVDIEAIKAEGYSVITPIIITNTDNYTEVKEVKKGEVKKGEDLIYCKKTVHQTNKIQVIQKGV